MDPSKLEDYKAWQRGEILGDMASVAYIEGLDVDAMEGQVIRLFGTDLADYETLRTVGNRLNVEATDSNSEARTVYHAVIRQTGRLAGSDTQVDSPSFQSGRWGEKIGRNIARLQAESEPPQAMVDASDYWVSIEILSRRQARVMEIWDKNRCG